MRFIVFGRRAALILHQAGENYIGRDNIAAVQALQDAGGLSEITFQSLLRSQVTLCK